MNDDKLARELREVYGRDLPGDEFDQAVMDRTLADSGGEHEVALGAPSGRRWWPFVAAAAVVLLIVGVWRLAAPEPVQPKIQCNLPSLAAPGNERIVVSVDAEGKTSVGGMVLSPEELKKYLTLRVNECRKDKDPQETYLYIKGDAKVGSGHITKLLEVCADHPFGIREFQFASGEVISVTDGGWNVEPDPDPPIEDRPAVPPAKSVKVKVVLKWEKGDTSTQVWLGDRNLGCDDEGFTALDSALEKLTTGLAAAGQDLPMSGEIHAWAHVPHNHVIRAIDALMKVDITDITFIGTPPSLAPEPRSRPALHVYLRAINEDNVLIIGDTRTLHKLTHHKLDEGLVALDAAIRKLAAAGPKPVGFLHATVYADQKAVKRILEVFKSHGIEDVTIIR